MKASLFCKSGTSDKEYHIQIVEHGQPEDGGFKVNFQYGRRGGPLVAQQKRAMFTRLKRENKEGIVFKRKSATFTTGRLSSGGDQLKCKFWDSLSARIKTIRPGGANSIECELFDGKKWVTCGNTTVLTIGLLDTLKVGDVAEIRYLYALKDTGILYQSSFLGKRDDVDASECLVKQIKTKGTQ